jgi:hypothetical protein
VVYMLIQTKTINNTLMKNNISNNILINKKVKVLKPIIFLKKDNIINNRAITKSIMMTIMEIITKIIMNSKDIIKMIEIIKIMGINIEIMNIRFLDDNIKKAMKEDENYKK